MCELRNIASSSSGSKSQLCRCGIKSGPNLYASIVSWKLFSIQLIYLGFIYLVVVAQAKRSPHPPHLTWLAMHHLFRCIFPICGQSQALVGELELEGL
uniref:Uncharacterized protein n=1 Tax=Fundulus heteroclitus TaxID=8078 RepID=A0A3Q2NSI2_FUNHE